MVHFVSRFTCLLLVVVIQQMVIYVRSDTFYNMTTNVSKSGQDSKSCFNRGFSCKTLVYALQFLAEYRTGHPFPSVLINVTYNQTINGTYNVRAPNISILRITGNEGVYINFPYRDSSLEIVHRYTWAWINLRFVWHGECIFGMDCINPSVTHFGDTSTQTYLSMLNCMLGSVTWKVVNVTNFVINNTEFNGISASHDSFCSTVYVECSENSQTQCAITISNNVVCKCQL